MIKILLTVTLVYYALTVLSYGIPYLAYRRKMAQTRAPGTPRIPDDELPRLVAIAPVRASPASIAGMVAGLRQQVYPSELYRTIILIDTDGPDDPSGEIARAGGAEIYERRQPAIRTKGAALNELLSAKLRNEPFDAVLILDIDARMESDFLRRVAAHLKRGAHAIQAAQLSKIADESEVMYISHAAQALSQMMQQARSALGLTAILAGTGMVFSRQALEQLNWQTSVGRRLSDDGELNMRCLLHDIRVIYGADLLLRNDLPASAREVRLQRRRWNEAYIRLGPVYAWPLLRKVARGSWRVLEAFFALAMLPSCSLSFLIAGIGLILLDFWTVADPSLIPYTATLLVLWMTHGLYYISALKTLGCDLRQEDFKILPRFMAMRALGVLEGAWLACRRDPGKRSIPSEHKDEQKEKQEALL